MPAVEIQMPLISSSPQARPTSPVTFSRIAGPPFCASVGISPRLKTAASSETTPYLMAVPPMSMLIYFFIVAPPHGMLQFIFL